MKQIILMTIIISLTSCLSEQESRKLKARATKGAGWLNTSKCLDRYIRKKGSEECDRYIDSLDVIIDGE